MDTRQQIDIIRLLKNHITQLNAGYQTDVTLAHEKADMLINQLEKVNNSGVLDIVSGINLVEFKITINDTYVSYQYPVIITEDYSIDDIANIIFNVFNSPKCEGVIVE